jgi:hypothetical protein
MKYPTFLMLLLLSANLFGQQKPKVILSTSKTRVLYCGLDNTIEVMVEGSPQRKFTVKVDSGTLKKIDQYHYEFKPTKPGIAILLVLDEKGRELLRNLLPIRKLPPPVFTVGGHNNGSMAINVFKAQGGITESKDCLTLTSGIPRSKVISYTINIYRNGNSLAMLQAKGEAFSDEARQLFNELKIDDKVVFSNIEYECLPCVRKEKLEGTMEFIME